MFKETLLNFVNISEKTRYFFEIVYVCQYFGAVQRQTNDN